MPNQFTLYTKANIAAAAGNLITELNTALITGQSWTAPYTAANASVYRAPSGLRHYFQVRDIGDILSGAAMIAYVNSYETMSAYSTGTNVSTTMVMQKTNNGTNCLLHIYADARTVYIFSQWLSTNWTSAVMFGEFYSIVPGDAYNTMIVGNVTTGSNNATGESLDKLNSTNMASTTQGHFTMRGYAQTGSIITSGVHGDFVRSNGALGVSGTPTAPNAPDGSVSLSPIWVHESGVIRGRLRGLWQVCNAGGLTDGNLISGTGDLAGKTFRIVTLGGALSGNSFKYCIEISATLETN